MKLKLIKLLILIFILALRSDIGIAVAGSLNSITNPPPGIGTDPLSSVVAVYPTDSSKTFAQVVKEKVAAFKTGALSDANFPLPISATANDEFRVIDGLTGNVLVSWMDLITADGKKFGANNDYISYFGDGWEVGGVPQWNGDPNAGHLWVNNEYVSVATFPEGLVAVNNAPDGQQMTLAKHLQAIGVLPAGTLASNDYWSQDVVNIFVTELKKQIGGSWMRIRKEGGEWMVDKNDPSNERYNATDSTLFSLSGPSASAHLDHDDSGNPLPNSIVVGTLGNCSGGTTPWGTILTAEENNQDYYGDPERALKSRGLFALGEGYDPGSIINPDYTPDDGYLFTNHSNQSTYHNKDMYGYTTEMDPGRRSNDWFNKTSAGSGHSKHLAFGQARWENYTLVTDTSWHLEDGKPIVIYYANDRRGGRVHKFVSDGVYSGGMSKEQARNLLASGTVYVSHLPNVKIDTGYTMTSTGAAPTRDGGHMGQWIELSIDNNRDLAINQNVSRCFNAKDGTEICYDNKAGTTVGSALRDVNWNGIGGFDTQAKVLSNLFTAAEKIGVFEQNRPEDVEYNPFDHTIYMTFTYHGKRIWLAQDGGLINGDRSFRFEDGSEKRADNVGRIWAFKESDTSNPADSMTFQFWEVAHGSSDFSTSFTFGRPDNILIDRDGGVWFGTDGQPSPSKGAASDSIYYLDINQAVGTGTAYRVLSLPSDSEATGPALNSDMSTLFLSVQHPGESHPSIWPSR